eukprot:m.175462 g.175462  ORF g.175462 m.175462 type:complete len:283 (-) comp17349_c1_seq1:1698-2546(-)
MASTPSTSTSTTTSKASSRDDDVLPVGERVSARSKGGSYYSAAIGSVNRDVHYVVRLEDGSTTTVAEKNVRGKPSDQTVKVKCGSDDSFVTATIVKLLDKSQYHMLFDDGQTATVPRAHIRLPSQPANASSASSTGFATAGSGSGSSASATATATGDAETSTDTSRQSMGSRRQRKVNALNPAVESSLKVMTRGQLRHGIKHGLFTAAQEECALEYLNNPQLSAQTYAKRQSMAGRSIQPEERIERWHKGRDPLLRSPTCYIISLADAWIMSRNAADAKPNM